MNRIRIDAGRIRSEVITARLTGQRPRKLYELVLILCFNARYIKAKYRDCELEMDPISYWQVRSSFEADYGERWLHYPAELYNIPISLNRQLPAYQWELIYD